MATPAWLGATAGQPPKASQVNQLLGTHATTYIYTGALFSSQTTAGSGSVNSDGLYIAQSITTGSGTTTLGRVTLEMTVTGGPTPMTIQLQSNASGAPSGTVLTSTTIPPGWGNGTQTYQSIPLPASGLSPSTTYWVVLEAAGDASDYFTFYKSTQASGASTSTNGTTWTAQTYGLLYSAYDQTAVLPLVHTWEDAGARIVEIISNPSGSPAAIEEYTVAQGTNQYMYSYRSLSYSGTSLVSVA